MAVSLPRTVTLAACCVGVSLGPACSVGQGSFPRLARLAVQVGSLLFRKPVCPPFFILWLGLLQRVTLAQMLAWWLGLVGAAHGPLRAQVVRAGCQQRPARFLGAAGPAALPSTPPRRPHSSGPHPEAHSPPPPSQRPGPACTCSGTAPRGAVLCRVATGHSSLGQLSIIYTVECAEWSAVVHPTMSLCCVHGLSQDRPVKPLPASLGWVAPCSLLSLRSSASSFLRRDHGLVSYPCLLRAAVGGTAP